MKASDTQSEAFPYLKLLTRQAHKRNRPSGIASYITICAVRLSLFSPWLRPQQR